MTLSPNPKQWTRWLTGDLTPAILAAHHDTIEETNARLLRYAATLGLASGIGLLLVSAGENFMSSQMGVHFAFSLAMLVLFSFVPTARDHYRNATRMTYVFMGACYLFAILNSVVLFRDQQGALICVAFAVLPMLVTDVFWRCVLPGVIAWPIYAVVNMMYCMPDVRVMNLLNTFVALSIGIMLTRFNIENRARELASRDTLVGQRDTDVLTKAVTRRSGEERIKAILDRGDVPCAMIMVDIDNFKGINDTYGHGYGDKVLEMVAQLLRDNFRSTDLVCRMGGDEFMVFVVGVPEDGWIETKAANLLMRLADTPAPDGRDAVISISMGIVLSPRYGTEFDELYRKADHALYNAKRAGKNCYHLFGSEAL